MKIEITETSKREAKCLHDNLKSALEDFTVSNSTIEKLYERQPVLDTEIATLEKTISHDDRKAIARLTEMKAERDLVNQKLEELGKAKAGTPEAETLHHLLTKVYMVVKGALTKPYNQLEKEIANAFRPFYTARGFEITAARETDKLKAFANFMHARYDTFGANVIEARRALTLLEEIMDGELSWSFNPNSRFYV